MSERILHFPDLSKHQAFDPNDPIDARADAVRRIVAEAFIKHDVTITPENAQATLAGLMVALVGVAAACTKPEGHRDLVVAIQDMTPWAMNMARDLLGLPQLQDN